VKPALPLTLLLLAAALPASAETHRVAVIVGSNAGSGEFPALRWAEADAGKMARLLTEVGQVRPGDLFLLQGRSLEEVDQALRLAEARVAELHRLPDARVVLIFFFSGHSDGEALELGRQRLPFAQLKRLLAATDAEVRLTIIDACKSGAAVQIKGGKPAPAFTIRLSDELQATGEVMLTSSAADEVALESREVRGSYVTHHLVSGLRGAADVSGDGLVTLAEAYRYAYDRTLSATSSTLTGPQHPVYDYRLSGQGELVLATLSRTTASLVLPSGYDRVLVVDLARDQVVAELGGGSGGVIAVPPGTVGIRAFRGAQAFGGRFQIRAGETIPIPGDVLVPVEAPLVASKGETPPSYPAPPVVTAPVVTAPPPTASVVATPVTPASLPPPIPIIASKPGPPWSLCLSGGPSGGLSNGMGRVPMARLAFEPTSSLGFAVVGTTGQTSGDPGFSESALQARIGYHFRNRGAAQVLLGGEIGPGIVWQSSNGWTGSSMMLVMAPRLAARFTLVKPVFLSLELEGALAVLKVDGELDARWMPSASLGLGLSL